MIQVVFPTFVYKDVALQVVPSMTNVLSGEF